MTGPGRSPTSPLVQSAPGRSCDGRTTHPFGLPSANAGNEQTTPNYFGITVQNAHDSPNPNLGQHAQKNWGSVSHAQESLPSPKLQLYSQESVSEGLANLLKAESDSEKGRRESAFQRGTSNGKAHAPNKRGDIGTLTQGTLGGRGPMGGNSSRSSSQGDAASVSSHWISADQCAGLLRTSPRDLLLLDVRPYAHFAQGNIQGSLNLCIPTTLLKRRSFDTQKLQATFANDLDKQTFARWRECFMIIVYDVATNDAKDAVPLLNVVNKFQSEGWQGQGLILKGGFKDFSTHFPQLIQRPRTQAPDPSPKQRAPMNINLHSVAPVVGGCAIPDSSSAANPFFGNIRQNMDLMGGVGQIPLRLPDELTEAKKKMLPLWLRDAADVTDQGRIISDKFLELEKKELERMKQALSYEGSSASTGGASKKYRVAGIEKGTKNRYNDIYPFDHTRVRLEGIPSGGCDYVNANHIKAEFSNRRYIATQAPVPDTFNDFWRVIWEQDVRLVVSLTSEFERGQVKCHPYWRSGDYGPFKVKTHSDRSIRIESRGRPIDSLATTSSARDEHAHSPDDSNENPVIIVRHFSLYHSSQPFQQLREITQLQYPYWPDFGTTSQPTHLLNLIEQCNKVIRATSISRFGSKEPEPSGQRPILVHCSAGCGRTGTFCTVDSVLDMLKRQHAQSANPANSSGWIRDSHLDLIVKAVEDFRTQRPSMVQNLSQFVLCYESVLEWLVSQMDESDP